MKPFNLKQALAGAPVITRDGRKARLICDNRVLRDTRVLMFLVKYWDTDNETVLNTTLDGSANLNGVGESNRDIFMAPVKRRGWVNLHKNDHYELGICTGRTVFASKRDAKVSSCSNDYITTIPVEWEE